MTAAFAPTPEQAAIVDAYQCGKELIVEAGAGTGKTSTLVRIGSARPRAKVLYLAYNAAAKEDARGRFPRNVKCMTSHGLARRVTPDALADRIGRPRVSARVTAQILGITGPQKFPAGNLLAPTQLARIVMETIAKFCYSADDRIGPDHVADVKSLEAPEDRAALCAMIPPLAQKAWDRDLTQPSGRLRFTHDIYLKMFALRQPYLSYDAILLDEAQDSNRCVAAMVEAQGHAQKVMVGDRCQAIYGWRGATDAMATFQADQRLLLSQSFRFGHAVADEANLWLELLRSPLRLRGFDKIPSVVGPIDLPDAVLCRTNVEAIRQVMAAIKADRKPALAGKSAGEIIAFAEAAITLKAGQGCDHPELIAFQTWGQVQDYVEQDAAGGDLATFVKLIDEYGAEVIIDTVRHLSLPENADVVVSTAHQAKGLEWGKVKIASDFPEPKPPEDDPFGPRRIRREDAMLAYVAVTRAREGLDNEGLQWVTRYLPKAAA